MKPRTIVYTISLVIALIASSWLAISITKNMLNENKRQQNDSDFFMTNVVYTKVDETGTVQNQLRAPKIIHYPTTGTYALNLPQLMMMDKNSHPWYISALNGLSKKNGQVIYLWNNVIIDERHNVTQQSLMKISTNLVTLYPQQKTANTDKALTITQGGSVVNAVGANVDFNTSTVKLLSQVKGQYAPATSLTKKN